MGVFDKALQNAVVSQRQEGIAARGGNGEGVVDVRQVIEWQTFRLGGARRVVADYFEIVGCVADSGLRPQTET